MPLLAVAAAVASSWWRNRYSVCVSQRPPVEIRWWQQLLHSFLCLLSRECFVFLFWEFPPLWGSVKCRIEAVPSNTWRRCLCWAWRVETQDNKLFTWHKNTKLGHHIDTTKRSDKPAKGEFLLGVRLWYPPWSLPNPSWRPPFMLE